MNGRSRLFVWVVIDLMFLITIVSASCPEPPEKEPGKRYAQVLISFCKLDENIFCTYTPPLPDVGGDLYVRMSSSGCTEGNSSGASKICNLDCCSDSITGTDNKCYSLDADHDIDENVCTLNPDNTLTGFKWQTTTKETNGCCGDDPLYVREITIFNQNSVLTDYPVRIVLNTQHPISAGKIRSDCGDIRFKDSDKTTELDYWIESGCDSASTKIWIRVPSIPASSAKKIYLYYGNLSATFKSNKSALYDFYDEFNGKTKFQTVAQPYGDPHDCGCSNRVDFSNTGDKEKLELDCYDEAELRATLNLPSSNYKIILNWSGDDQTENQVGYHTHYCGGGIETEAKNCGISPKRVVLVNKYTLYLKQGKLTNFEELKEMTYNGEISTLYLAVSSNGCGTTSPYYKTYYDYIYVRKYASQEPTTTIGNENLIGPDYGYISSNGQYLCNYDGSDWKWLDAQVGNAFRIITIDPPAADEAEQSGGAEGIEKETDNEDIKEESLLNKFIVFIKNIFS